jgi:hypothetical protein
VVRVVFNDGPFELDFVCNIPREKTLALKYTQKIRLFTNR